MAGLMVDRAPGRGGGEARLPLSTAAPHFPRLQETPGQVPPRAPALPASPAPLPGSRAGAGHAGKRSS